MKRSVKRLFENKWVDLSEQVTAEIMRRSGFVIAEDLGAPRDKRKRKRYPKSVVNMFVWD